ncbi:amino acid adenylation domain-containing protein [Streptomyces sp. NBC_01013]|uniref:amino acid adenylation domain-containing protein n=1 Tax=Streptomyces sp. NBC_01013 TaxID=2903718 RepID=UPI00386975FF|nr:amino acid adenylation domain-containing protein [Streptomyces sp. NBC_01013]
MNAEQRSGDVPDIRPRPSAAGGSPLLHERFAAQALRTPHAVAVVDGADTVTYAELDRAANRMGHFLRGLGAGPDSVIGVSLERGTDLVVALLGVWKAGAAYLPLDPGQPPARLTGLVRAAGAQVVLAGPALEGAVRDAGARRAGPDEVPADLSDTAPAGGADPDGAAYTVFTSGSTGTPKGVVITHAGIANRVGWTVRKHGLGPDDRILQKTSIGFDAAGWEIFAPLVGGGSVVLAPTGAERDPAALLRAVADYRVTVLQVVPSVLRILVEEGDWSGCDSLRLLFSAGEALHGELVARLREKAGPALEVWNTYGPTECSIDITAQPVDPAQTSGAIPIGRPIPGMRVLVLGPNGDPVPIGTPGELYAGGTGVARGYLGRPDLTAERFVPDPYASEPGSRLYRTGDLVRWRTDRTLDYLGRLDHQVKVNGVRIEPAEIEAALTAHPGVSGAVVLPYEAERGSKRLAAHLTTTGPEAAGPSADVLRAFLRERLPESHIPSFFHTLDAFPLTPNGKADRAMLPTPGEIAAADQLPFVAPRTDSEQLVANAWADLLGLDRVGAHDDFFALGGTSLQLTRLAARLRAASGAQISLRGLLRATTVEAQAGLIEVPAADESPIVPVPRDGDLPLSSGQRRLWFLDRMHPGSPEWVAPLFLRLPAHTGADTVRRALEALSARHEALRTVYPDRGGEPCQVIGEAGAQPVELRVEDTSREGVEQLFREQFGRGFDLSAGPLWRALLARTGGDHVLLLTLHHITVDGWSTVILERELRELCAAFEADRAPVLPALPVQYADYGAWQHARLTDDFIAGELAHWRTALAGIEPLDLPLDHPRPAERDPRGAVVPFRVEPELADRLAELGRAHRATPFMTLLTAYATLIARYSGGWDIPVGTPVAGRGRPETEGTVGFFLNSLVVRCALDADVTFADALDRVSQAARAAFAHQELPFERLVDELQPERDLSRTPLYQVAFDLHSEGVTSVATDDEDMAAFTASWQVAKTDLSLFMRRTEDGALEGVFEYAAALFERATVEQLTGHFTRLLRQVTQQPGLPLGTVDFLSADERGRLLLGWNATEFRAESETVLARVEARAAAAPDVIALSYGSQSVTYGELDARANRLAHLLRDRGVGAESRVAVLLDRGPDLVTALLAVWKAGGAYLPVDPSCPAERLTAMRRSAYADTVITSSAHAPAAGDGAVLVDTDAARIAAGPATRPARTDDLDRLAYVIFTSGSTGTPKGVEVTHRGLANHVAWAARELAPRDYGGAALFSSVAFDLVVPNLWAPLVTGQRLFLLPQDTDLSELGKHLDEAAPYSFLKLTPGHLDVLAHQLTPAQAGALAPVLVVAGEAFSRATLERWRALAPDTRLVNEYGPTEASVGTCVFEVPDGAGGAGTEILPIGRPLPNMTMYVLDERLQPVPAGVAGELYVGGTGVARGYANRPDLTAERFLPDPFGGPGARFYRTGDRVRRRTDGNVEFLGRFDDQVKIRGYRVELGEVQAVLTEHPAVRETFLAVHTTDNGEKQLVAYYVPEAGDDPADTLAAHCALRLPDYMVPTVWTPLDALPLNANGKVDRRALPVPGAGTGTAEQVEPSGPVEERIAEIWTELLGTRAGAHDNFFHVGGNSILAIRLISRIQEEFEIDFAVRTVFEGPTIARLAATVEERIRAEIAALTDSELVNDEQLVKGYDA